MQSPDEHSHLARSYLISTGQLGLETPAGESSGGNIDVNLVRFWTPYLYTVAVKAEARLSRDELNTLEQIRWSDRRQFFAAPGTGYYMPLVYLPQALALWVGRSQGLTISNTYWLTRCCTLAVCIALLALAFRVYQPTPLVIALLLLPMNVFQVLAPTLDGMTHCLTICVLSLFMRCTATAQSTTSTFFYTLSLGVFALVTSRVQLILLLSLPLYLAWQGRSWRHCGIASLLGILSLMWIFYALQNTIDIRISRSQGTTELLLYYAQSPMAFVKVVAASLGDSVTFQFYERSFVGILGWLDTYLPTNAYGALWGGLIACACASLAAVTDANNGRTRALLVLVASVAAGLVFLALLVTWTPHPAKGVDGVQGRYFWAPMAVMAFALGGGAHADGSGRTRWRRWFAVGLPAGFGLMALGILITTLVSRYH